MNKDYDKCNLWYINISYHTLEDLDKNFYDKIWMVYSGPFTEKDFSYFFSS